MIPTNWHPWAWLAPALVLLMAFVANYADLRESWELGEPGARHFALLPWLLQSNAAASDRAAGAGCFEALKLPRRFLSALSGATTEAPARD